MDVREVAGWNRSWWLVLVVWMSAFGVVSPVAAEEPVEVGGQAEVVEAEAEPVPDPPSIDPPDPSTVTSPGFLLGQQLRYGEAGVFKRVLFDVAAIPGNLPRWDEEDWALFTGLNAAGGALMWPLQPSLDVRIDRGIRDVFDPWMPDIWGMEFQIPLWGGLAVGGFGSWGIGALTGNDELAESMSLVGESVAVAQVYHLFFKLLTGRQGPRRGEKTGLFLGPTEAPRLFPEGTPSGHFATIYAIYGASQAYWEFPLVWDVVGHAVIGTLAATHVLNHRHYASEIVLGSAMGYAISHWVVRHRSTRFRYDAQGNPVRVNLVPGPGNLSLSIQF